jgi:iron complex outermembrane receptor protein
MGTAKHVGALAISVSMIALSSGALAQSVGDKAIPRNDASGPIARPDGSAAVTGRAEASPGASDRPSPTSSLAGDTDIVVTGSRVASNGNQAPTPVTVVSTERLLQSAPSNIPDAINRLPQFAAQPSTRNIQNAQTVAAGNFLNLRRFGSNRNLILLDGNRVPPTAASGAVDTNTIPQSLVQKVEIVTGGASAVYGSDAVTGVVNFVIDKHFNGLKVTSQIGTSTYGDNTSWRVGGAAGHDLFDGRGHIEASFDHYDSKGLIGLDSRSAGRDNWIVGGNGTAANPYRLLKNGRVLTGARGGYITGNPPAALRELTFNANGVATPFVHGAPTGVSGLESGGDGGYYDAGTLVAPLRTNQAFGRFDYEISDGIQAYVQGSYSDAVGVYPYASARFSGTVLSGNPFIPANIQTIMTATNTPSITIARLQSREDGLPGRVNDTLTRNRFEMAGLKGKVFGGFDWSVNYINAESIQRVRNRNNTSAVKFAAAVDAVRDPATGRVVCQVSLTPSSSRFPGCEPLNLFGPTAPSRSAYDWVTDDTQFKLSNKMDDVNFAIAGSPFSLWAGPVRVALSGEYRWLSLRNRSSVESTTPPDCTGLRSNCTATTPAWQHDVSSSVFAKQNVKEIAGEVLVPLLKDVPLVRSLELNMAGRFTDYSTSGSVKTWKLGLSWQVTDDLRIRGARSRDIRAPTLQDLFAAVAIRPVAFADIHSGAGGITSVVTQGNASLVPEIAMTNTIGFIYQPKWIPGFNVAIDYYQIKINNAIIGADGQSTQIQRECEDSNGASPFCALYDRPLPFSDKTPANYPTRVFVQNINASRQWTRGIDVEANYRFNLDQIAASAPGALTIRGLAAYQPTLKRRTVASVPAAQSAGIAGFSKITTNVSVDYTVGPFSALVTERWQSHQSPSDPAVNVDLRPEIPAYSYTDVTLNYRAKVGSATLSPFITVENLFNKKPPIIGTGNSVPGLFYPTPANFDVVGRYFTAGVRASF